MAVTLLAAAMITVQLPVPEQAPDQPVKLEPASAEAVSVTEVLMGKAAVQVAPQLMPLGELVTVPEPEPFRLTLRV